MYTHTPTHQVDHAIAQALEEASLHGGNAPGLDFDAFLKLLRTGATDDLSQYDDRMSTSMNSSSESLSDAAGIVFDEEAAEMERKRLEELAGMGIVLFGI